MIYVVVREQAREREIIRTHLRPFVNDGLLSGEEVEMLCHPDGWLRALQAAPRPGGLAEYQMRSRFRQAGCELAFHRWRVGRGISRGAPMDAEREAEYLRILSENRLHRIAPALGV